MTAARRRRFRRGVFEGAQLTAIAVTQHGHCVSRSIMDHVDPAG
jgi:hypothetical protein